MNAHGFKQVQGMYHDEKSIVAPVANEVTIRISLVTSLLLKLQTGLLDVKGAFLQGEFDENEKDVCMSVSDGVRNACPDNI